MNPYTNFLFSALFMAGCAAAPRTADQEVTVEGRVTVRGAEPFTVLVLETDGRNSYVLRLDEAQRSALQHSAPGRFRVVGILYEEEWNGEPYAHLRVTSWQAAGQP